MVEACVTRIVLQAGGQRRHLEHGVVADQMVLERDAVVLVDGLASYV